MLRFQIFRNLNGLTWMMNTLKKYSTYNLKKGDEEIDDGKKVEVPEVFEFDLPPVEGSSHAINMSMDIRNISVGLEQWSHSPIQYALQGPCVGILGQQAGPLTSSALPKAEPSLS